jgi:hypothetical protein
VRGTGQTGTAVRLAGYPARPRRVRRAGPADGPAVVGTKTQAPPCAYGLRSLSPPRLNDAIVGQMRGNDNRVR